MVAQQQSSTDGGGKRHRITRGSIEAEKLRRNASSNGARYDILCFKYGSSHAINEIKALADKERPPCLEVFGLPREIDHSWSLQSVNVFCIASARTSADVIPAEKMVQ